MIPFSVLDLSPIPEGGDAADALRNTLDLARHAEALGYRRYWLAEHHNMPGIASAATAVVIGHVVAGTSTIRVGAGGIMLPNHSPLVIAEQFGTLATLYPGRIDLGLGRAPGTDPLTSQALRRDIAAASEHFPRDVVELQALLAPARPGQAIRAIPGAGTSVPLWILGSSLFGAQLAALLGLPFAFASHFAPAQLLDALAIYRERFQPSENLDQPYAAVAVGAYAADTDEEAGHLFTSMQQAFVNLRRGAPGLLPRPKEGYDAQLSPPEQNLLARSLAYSAVGSQASVAARLRAIIEETQPDELIVTGQIHDPAARLRSFEIVARIRDELGGAAVMGPGSAAFA
jgi:luciferase family oxidoreductase group 1